MKFTPKESISLAMSSLRLLRETSTAKYASGKMQRLAMIDLVEKLPESDAVVAAVVESVLESFL